MQNKAKHLLISSQFRNRQLYPRADEWILELDTQGTSKFTSVDPVCLSCPLLTWRQFNTTVVSLTNVWQNGPEETTRLSISAAIFAAAEASIKDFFVGANFITPEASYRVMTSERVAPSTILISVSGKITEAELTAGPLSIQDTWIPTQNWIRAPTYLDFGGATILYNQSQGLFVRILEITKDRRLILEAPITLWSVSDTIGIRSEMPSLPYTIVGINQSTLTLNTPLQNENVGDWLRILRVGLTEEDTPKARIVSVNNLGQAVIYPNFLPAVGEQVELLRYSYDNAFSNDLRAARGEPARLRLIHFYLHGPQRPKLLRLGLGTLNDSQPAFFANNPLMNPRGTWLLEYNAANEGYEIVAGQGTVVVVDTAAPLLITLVTLTGEPYTKIVDRKSPSPTLLEPNYILMLEMA